METNEQANNQEIQEIESYQKFDMLSPTLSFGGYEDFDFIGI